MLQYIPTGWIGNLLGGEDIGTIILAGLIGVPAYLNDYATISLVGATLTQEISAGAAMSFIIAGGITCIPAAVAVWALVKPKVFIVYLNYAMLGAIGSEMAWQTASGWLFGAWRVTPGALYPMKFTNRATPRITAIQIDIAPVRMTRDTPVSGPYRRYNNVIATARDRST